MSAGALLFVLVALGIGAGSYARARVALFARGERATEASTFARGARATETSRFARVVRPIDPPRYHGWFAAAWTIVPAASVLAAWIAFAPGLATRWVVARHVDLLAGARQPAVDLLARARALAATGATNDPLAVSYVAADARVAWIGTALTLAVALAGGMVALARVRPALAARAEVERAAMTGLAGAALAAIIVTVGIAAMLVIESLRFFDAVPVTDFLLGTHWSPQTIDPAHPGATLGAVPLLWGTFFIGGVIAMAVAVPLGLMSAIWLAHYASASARRRTKPILELLAGIPTVVYGYFAVLTVAPLIRDMGVALGVANASTESALAAGSVMGVMLIPLVSSLSDDAFAAVPRELRDASLALGATMSETVRSVLFPAALPGITGGILLAVSRAVGETMIVVMVASGVATLTANPFAPATTVTKQIVDLLTGEATFDSPKTLAAFALGLLLFLATLALNVIALVVVRRHRAAYE